jgi:hypothetical protein
MRSAGAESPPCRARSGHTLSGGSPAGHARAGGGGGGGGGGPQQRMPGPNQQHTHRELADVVLAEYLARAVAVADLLEVLRGILACDPGRRDQRRGCSATDLGYPAGLTGCNAGARPNPSNARATRPINALACCGAAASSPVRASGSTPRRLLPWATAGAGGRWCHLVRTR